ncbi:MAG: twin-arginine translocase TatA/TatE family subunit [Acidimicrobiia bacterium]|nr:twin-arginine translocase TatA/TatE family subunit [Actinomycetota bacterium]MBL6925362.1 twin-arginine translocase TatA/TatE family subunit [Acidimicrobiia bacterium]MBL6925920.1 twin-arginine translocase TatA/TatE family subunit [Acidimicrobiia bacterium]
MNVFAFLSTNELLIVLIVGVVLFGGSQLPKLARNLGRAQKELQKGLAEGAKEVDAASDGDSEASSDS